MEVFTNYRFVSFPQVLEVDYYNHYIGSPDNLPSNPRRTINLLGAVRDYFMGLLLKEMEKEIKEIARWQIDADQLQASYHGKHFWLEKGLSAKEVLNQLWSQYTMYQYASFFGKSFYDILLEIIEEDEDGFLLEAAKESISWLDSLDEL